MKRRAQQQNQGDMEMALLHSTSDRDSRIKTEKRDKGKQGSRKDFLAGERKSRGRRGRTGCYLMELVHSSLRDFVFDPHTESDLPQGKLLKQLRWAASHIHPTEVGC